MLFEKTLEELKNLKDVRPKICEKIKSHNLPVIVFGAAATAMRTSNFLKAANIDVAGYAVDEEYYQPNKTYLERPVYNFAEISKTPDKYVFVLGVNDESKGTHRSSEFANNKNIIHYEFLVEYFPNSITYDYVLANHEKFAETFSCLADELSQKSLINFLKLKITHDLKYSIEFYHPNQYFNELTNGVRTPNGGGYIDCGAYNGDTVAEFINWNGGNYEKIFAIEADTVNFAELEKFIATKNYKNVVPVNCGVWNEKTTLQFLSSDESNKTNESMNSDIFEKSAASVLSDGDIVINTDTIDNITGGEKINFIKMDIEGSELPALQGAAETIKKFKPTLAICAYHKAEDLITLPQFIKSLNPNYKFYLRKHMWAADTDLVLYAIP